MINFQVSFLTDNKIENLFYVQKTDYTYYNNMVFNKKK